MEELGLGDADLGKTSPQDFRRIVRSGAWSGPTDGSICAGYAQMNLAVVPKAFAFEFLLFCHRNPRVFSLNDITDPGDPHPRRVAPEADLRTDLPRYRVFEHGGLVAEPTDINDYWRDDLVACLTGATLGNEWLLRAANVKFRYIGALLSTIQCVPAGRFRGPMVVACRLVKGPSEAIRAVQITASNPAAHGAPVFIGDPADIGIKDFNKGSLANYKGERLEFAPPEPDEIPMFWANANSCQTTEAVRESRLPLMITHKGTHMFIADKLNAELTVQ